jgi:hypothetical protein
MHASSSSSRDGIPAREVIRDGVSSLRTQPSNMHIVHCVCALGPVVIRIVSIA